MNVARFVVMAVPAGVVVTYFVMQSLTVGESPHRELVTSGELMEEVSRRSFAGLYDAIETGFPEAYADHADEIREIALDTDVASYDLGPELIAESDAFVAQLREENAQYLPLAGRTAMLDIQRAQVALLKDLAGTPDLCVKVAQDGLDALDRYELRQIKRDLHGRWLVAQVDAMAAGRAAPEEFRPPTDADWGVFLRGWRDAEGAMTPAMEAYLSSDLSDAALYCEGALGFSRRLIADTTPSGLRILADYTGRSGT